MKKNKLLVMCLKEEKISFEGLHFQTLLVLFLSCYEVILFYLLFLP